MRSACDARLVDIIHVGNTLGEGVMWDDLQQLLWWTDIQERRLYRYDPNRGELKHYLLPQRLGSFGFVENSERLIAAFESGFALYDPPSGALEWVARPEHAGPNMRFNDGRVDRQGRFWAGSMTEGEAEPRGRLYCLTRSQARAHLSDIAIANSICFSADGRYLYFADTPQRAIRRYELDPCEGTLSNGHIFARTPEGSFPDGSNLDAQGHLWNAHWGGGRIVRYDPQGRVSGEIEVPVSQPTCITFGGPRLDLLFVTSARAGLTPAALAAQPHAGDVLVYSVSVCGLSDARYSGVP